MIIYYLILFFAFPAKRFRSNWMAIIAHSMQYLPVIPMLLALVLEMA